MIAQQLVLTSMHIEIYGDSLWMMMIQSHIHHIYPTYIRNPKFYMFFHIFSFSETQEAIEISKKLEENITKIILGYPAISYPSAYLRTYSVLWIV